MTEDALVVGPPDEPARYRLLRAQAIGGDRQIWLAERTAASSSEQVAIGVLRPSTDSDVEVWRAHYRERVELLMVLRHPGLSPLSDAFEGQAPHRPGAPDGPPALYLVADIAPGVPMRKWAATSDAELGRKVVAFEAAAEVIDMLNRGGGRRPSLFFGELDPDDVVVDGERVVLPILALEDDFPGRGDLADREAFARLVYMGLTGEELPAPTAEVVRSGARRHPQLGQNPDLVEALAAMWHPDVRHRPSSAVDWVGTLVACVEPLAPSPPQTVAAPMFAPPEQAGRARARRSGRAWVAVALIVAVAVVGVSIGPGRPLLDRLLGHDVGARVLPALVVASDTAVPTVDGAGVETAFDAAHLSDNEVSTAWRVPGDGVGQTITVTFDPPAHISRVGLVPGWALVDPVSGRDRFTQNRTVRRVRYTVDGVVRLVASYEPDPTLQTTRVDFTATAVVVEILATSEPGDRDFTAISELAFFGSAQR